MKLFEGDVVTFKKEDYRSGLLFKMSKKRYEEWRYGKIVFSSFKHNWNFFVFKYYPGYYPPGSIASTMLPICFSGTKQIIVQHHIDIYQESDRLFTMLVSSDSKLKEFAIEILIAKGLHFK